MTDLTDQVSSNGVSPIKELLAEVPELPPYQDVLKEMADNPKPPAEPEPPAKRKYVKSGKYKAARGSMDMVRKRLLEGEHLTIDDLSGSHVRALGNAVQFLKRQGIVVDSRTVRREGRSVSEYSVPGAPDETITEMAYTSLITKTPGPLSQDEKKVAARKRDAARKRERSALRRSEREAAAALADEPMLPAFSVADLHVGDRLRVVAEALDMERNVRQITLQVMEPSDVVHQIMFETDEPDADT